MFKFPTDKKYKVIYADPPWRYNDNKKIHPKRRGTATRHYPTMAIEDMKKLKVQDISDENCYLFMWATFSNLKEGLDLMESWGFKYKTLGFSWIKTNKINNKPCFGIGYYTRSNCEVCLIGLKGKPFKVSNSISSVIIEPREEHSKKPDIVREKIVEFTGDVPRIELFARNWAEGWDNWGNEIL